MNTFVQRVRDAGQFRHLPASLGIRMANRLFGTHSRLPSWPYSAVDAIAGLLQPDWRVLEFGAGWSTLWLADRCAEVISIESSPVWAAFVRKKSEPCGAAVEVIDRDVEDYAGTRDFADASFDLCIIDGLLRHSCFENALRVIRPGGYLYLDISEAPTDALVYTSEDRLTLRRTVPQVAHQTGGDLRECRGLIVGQVFTGEGILMRKGGS